MNSRDVAVLNRKRKSLPPWTGVGLLLGCLCLGAAAAMQPLEKHYEAARTALMKNSDVYRKASGMELTSDDLDFDLLGKPPKKQ